MSKFTCLVLCVLAVSITRIHATKEEKAAFLQSIKPFIDACSKEHGVSGDQIESATASHSTEGITPCFLGCVYKKTEVFNSKGEVDIDKALAKVRPFMSNDEEFAKFAEVGKKCVSVNDKAVSDGEAGCERGLLLTACFLENKAELPI